MFFFFLLIFKIFLAVDTTYQFPYGSECLLERISVSHNWNHVVLIVPLLRVAKHMRLLNRRRLQQNASNHLSQDEI